MTSPALHGSSLSNMLSHFWSSRREEKTQRLSWDFFFLAKKIWFNSQRCVPTMLHSYSQLSLSDLAAQSDNTEHFAAMQKTEDEIKVQDKGVLIITGKTRRESTHGEDPCREPTVWETLWASDICTLWEGQEGGLMSCRCDTIHQTHTLTQTPWSWWHVRVAGISHSISHVAKRLD